MSAPEIGKMEIRGTQVWLCYEEAHLGLKWRPILELAPLLAYVRAPEEPKKEPRYHVTDTGSLWQVWDNSIYLAAFDHYLPNAESEARSLCQRLNEQDGRER